jgi:hypothetical protein
MLHNQRLLHIGCLLILSVPCGTAHAGEKSPVVNFTTQAIGERQRGYLLDLIEKAVFLSTSPALVTHTRRGLAEVQRLAEDARRYVEEGQYARAWDILSRTRCYGDTSDMHILRQGPLTYAFNDFHKWDFRHKGQTVFSLMHMSMSALIRDTGNLIHASSRNTLWNPWLIEIRHFDDHDVIEYGTHYRTPLLPINATVTLSETRLTWDVDAAFDFPAKSRMINEEKVYPWFRMSFGSTGDMLWNCPLMIERLDGARQQVDLPSFRSEEAIRTAFEDLRSFSFHPPGREVSVALCPTDGKYPDNNGLFLHVWPREEANWKVSLDLVPESTEHTPIRFKFQLIITVRETREGVLADPEK